MTSMIQFWYGKTYKKTFTRVYCPCAEAKTRNVGIVISPPFGHEDMTFNRAQHNLALAMAESGFTVLRFDPFGTGDSEGSGTEDDLFESWIERISEYCEFLHKEFDLQKLVLFGTRLGALAGASAIAEAGAEFDGVIFYAPAISGRRFVREIMMADSMSAGPSSQTIAQKFDQIWGYPFSAFLQDSISQRNMTAKHLSNLSWALLTGREGMASQEDKLVKELLVRGVRATLAGGADYASVMTEASLKAKTWVPFFDTVLAHLELNYPQLAVAPAKQRLPAIDSVHEQVTIESITHAGSSSSLRNLPICESTGTLRGMHFVKTDSVLKATELSKGISTDFRQEETPLFVLSNMGTNRRVGTHRLYVNMAREIARQGTTVIRFDRRGIGESEKQIDALENIVYTTEAPRDLEEFVEELASQNGGRPIWLMGICSGAYYSYVNAMKLPAVRGIFLINIPVFSWKEGDPFELDFSQTFKPTFEYLNLLKKKSVLKRLLLGKVNFKGVTIKILKRLSVYLRFRLALLLNFYPLQKVFENELLVSFRKILNSGRSVRVLFAKADHGVQEFELKCGPKGALLEKDGNYKYIEIPGADHIFTSLENQRKLLQSLVETVREIIRSNV